MPALSVKLRVLLTAGSIGPFAAHGVREISETVAFFHPSDEAVHALIGSGPRNDGLCNNRSLSNHADGRVSPARATSENASLLVSYTTLAAPAWSLKLTHGT